MGVMSWELIANVVTVLEGKSVAERDSRFEPVVSMIPEVRTSGVELR